MATTRIIPMHINKGKTVAQCLTDRTNYAENKMKTRGGELISAYACDPKTVDAEFLFSKRQYKIITGREQKNDVIAYQVRQSFKPGEITPEEANRVGYEFAERFLKGKHAFIVATHIDRSHIHNHIIWNSTSLDCTRKFRDFKRSGEAVARLSDSICLEHGLSIVENAKRRGKSYNKWQGDDAKPSHRELLRTAIDSALAQKPADFEALLKLLRDAGVEADRRGRNIRLKAPGWKRPARLDTLGDEYGEAALAAVLSGKKEHKPRAKYAQKSTASRGSLLIDIDARLQAGKGAGFERWAKIRNLKQMALTVNYLREHNLLDYDELERKTADSSAQYNVLSAKIKSAETRMAEIAVLKTHIINYSKTREVYAGYRKAGYSKKYLAEHESDILLHKAAKKAFDDSGMKKLPTVKGLQAEYSQLLAAKKMDYAEYRTARNEMRDLLIHKQNVDIILGIDKSEAEKNKEHEQR